MKEKQKRYRLVLCQSHERKSLARFLAEKAEKFGFSVKDLMYGFEFYNPLSDTCDVVKVESCFSTHWTEFEDRAFVEVGITDQGKAHIESLTRKHLTDTLNNILSKPKFEGLDDWILYVLSEGKFNTGADPGISNSYTPDFFFPFSLFRFSMVEYFEVSDRPTREEFLLALTLEGIIAKNTQEKRAIEEAQIYCQRNGSQNNDSP